ncbi:hypothetical protein F7725_017068 [Dissostichus mawsoni]|uniref:Uncharacterized protein n=1 Tax=Dissostichus mawsoni TaxID=36200 RepID=A0A7J5Z3F4_DISMA|nr:hypothetical protein F7725_017068 [Dissostichus mawsoni]
MFPTHEHGTLLDLHTNGGLSAVHFTQTYWRESIRKRKKKVQIVNTNISSRQHLIAEMELVHTLSKLTPEERKVEVRRQMYVELKAVEMERRQTAALETLAKSERDGEETQKVTESLQKVNMETDRRRQEAPKERRQNQLKQERLQWQQVMLKGVQSPTHNFIALNEEQEKRREEADILTPDLKSPERKKKTLHNNWVAEKEMHSRPVSMQKDRLSVGHWVGKYQQNHEKKREKRRLKAEAQHAKYITSKSHGPQQSLLNELLDWYRKKWRVGLSMITPTISFWLREQSQSLMKDRLSVGHWVGKYQQNQEKKREKREKRRLKAEAQHEEYIASKSHGPQLSLLNELLDWSVC